jgi:hypothetical protein
LPPCEASGPRSARLASSGSYGSRLRRIARIREALRRDSAAGAAIVVPGAAEEPEHEFLPESGMVWTVAGAPSDWRLTPVSRDG